MLTGQALSSIIKADAYSAHYVTPNTDFPTDRKSSIDCVNQMGILLNIFTRAWIHTLLVKHEFRDNMLLHN